MTPVYKVVCSRSMSLLPEMQAVPLISYQEFISIVLTALAIILTALGIMLAVLGIGLAVLGFLGYTGLKEYVRAMAEGHVTTAMNKKLSEYPDAAELERKFMEEMQKKIVAKPANLAETVSEETENEPTAPISEPYPGDEPDDAHDTTHH